MFDFGLPVRGAITKGSFLIKKNCFAGQAIFKAESLATNLNCAGIAIAPSVTEWCNSDPALRLKSPIAFDYELPFKTSEPKAQTMLNVAWFLADPKDPNEQETRAKWAGDLRQLLHESFWAHGKSIGPGVPEKIEHTERMLRFLKLKRPDMFQDATGGRPPP
jgi:hypothetical protein